MDNPENCHSHSEIPDSWPPVEEILDYQTRVRARVESLFNKGDEAVRGVVGRALWLAFEHEGKRTGQDYDSKDVYAYTSTQLCIWKRSCIFCYRVT